MIRFVADHYEQAVAFSKKMQREGHAKDGIVRLNMYKPETWKDVKDCVVHVVDDSSRSRLFLNHCMEYRVIIIPATIRSKDKAVMK